MVSRCVGWQRVGGGEWGLSEGSGWVVFIMKFRGGKVNGFKCRWGYDGLGVIRNYAY